MTDCPMCGAPQGKRCLTKSGKRRGRPHTARITTQENTMPGEVIITDDMRRPDERVKVNPFRHPWIKGTDTDPECGRTWHDHGWIDRGDHGFTVCPTEAVRPDVLRDREEAAIGRLTEAEVERDDLAQRLARVAERAATKVYADDVSRLTAELEAAVERGDAAARERDEWKSRRDHAVEECRFLHQEGMSRRDHHLKHCGAARAAREAEAALEAERAKVARVEALIEGVGDGNLKTSHLRAALETNIEDAYERGRVHAEDDAYRRIRAALEGDR